MGNSPGTGEFPAQMASYAENVSIWWRHHGSDGFPEIKPETMKPPLDEDADFLDGSGHEVVAVLLQGFAIIW